MKLKVLSVGEVRLFLCTKKYYLTLKLACFILMGSVEMVFVSKYQRSTLLLLFFLFILQNGCTLKIIPPLHVVCTIQKVFLCNENLNKFVFRIKCSFNIQFYERHLGEIIVIIWWSCDQKAQNMCAVVLNRSGFRTTNLLTGHGSEKKLWFSKQTEWKEQFEPETVEYKLKRAASREVNYLILS